LSNGNYLDFDTQDISNQPTWAGGTIASLNQAAADISNW
jgi:predicted heme/steroid binding protein